MRPNKLRRLKQKGGRREREKIIEEIHELKRFRKERREERGTKKYGKTIADEILEEIWRK